ncbi:MAG: hypothetical protein QOH21_1546 [Acidobacteriota bacterium]|nr:hypothetical protein [Acidobacteriota bacterium]
MQAEKNTERALSIAASQSSSLRMLAVSGRTSAEAANRQRQAMENQIGLMQEQLLDARRAARQSADMFHDQLGIAKAQAESMRALADATTEVASGTKATSGTSRQTIDLLRQTLHLEQRGWIDLKQSHVGNLPWMRRRPYRLDLEYYNGGKTAVYDVTMQVLREVGPWGYPDLAYNRADARTFSFLGPGQSIIITPWARSIGWSRKKLRWADESGLWLTYIHGYITYKDVFGESHRLNICYAYYGASGHFAPCDASSTSRHPFPPSH